MSNLPEASGISEIGSADGHTYVHVLDDIEEAGLLRTTIETAWLTELEDRAYPNLPLKVIARERQSDDRLSEDEMRFLRQYGSDEVSNWFGNARPGVRVIRDLGYSSEVSREVVGDYTVQTIRATAPNIATWQRLAAGVPSEAGGSVYYLPYEGSRYPAYEAMKLFVSEHSVYMATHRPNKLHDHAEQPIGWFALGGPKMHTEVSRQTETAIEMAEFLAFLPRIGTVNLDHGQSGQEEEHANPVSTFMRRLYGRLDELATSVVYSLCLDPKWDAYRGDHIERIAGTIRHGFAPYTETSPRSLVQPIETDLSMELATEVLERFALLGVIASESASQKV